MGIQSNSRWRFLSLIAVVVFLTLALLYGCGGGGDDSNSSSGNDSSQNQNDSGSSSDNSGLPPDPGEEGKAILEGIDSDNDGIRDDVQRYLATTYADNSKLHATFKELARTEQQRLLSHQDKQESIRLFNESGEATKCLWSLFLSIPEMAKAEAALRKKIYNTNDRMRAYFAIQRQLGGGVYELKMERKCD